MTRFIQAAPLLGLLLASSALLGVGGCNGNKIDCAQVCAAYADCVDSDLDVRQCTRECEANADGSENRENRLERCEECIEGLSCTEQAFECTDECIGVIEPN